MCYCCKFCAAGNMYAAMCAAAWEKKWALNVEWSNNELRKDVEVGGWRRMEENLYFSKLNISLKWFTFMNYIFHIMCFQSFPILALEPGVCVCVTFSFSQTKRENFQRGRIFFLFFFSVEKALTQTLQHSIKWCHKSIWGWE